MLGTWCKVLSDQFPRPLDAYYVRVRDLRLAIRSLFRAPSFTLTAVLALGLGIGASTAVFSVADGTLFRALPYHEPDRLVAVQAAVRARGFLAWDVPVREIAPWREASRSLVDLAGGRAGRAVTVTRADEPVELGVAYVTRNYLSVLGVAPVRGRDFSDADFESGASRTLIVTDETWRRVFDADPAIAGLSIEVDGEPAHVIGVLPPAFAFPARRVGTDPVEALMPASGLDPGSTRLEAIARLASGATAAQAGAELDAVAASRRPPAGLRDRPIDGASAQPLTTVLTANRRGLLVLLLGAVASLLLIGCANVANLLLARSTERRAELGLRSALGASRSALVRLLLLESGVLAVAGGLVSVALSMWAVGVVRPLIPAELTALKPVVVDARALVFALGAAFVSVILCGLVPALRATRADAVPSLQSSSARATGAHVGPRQVIVGVEVALAMLLLVGGALMTNAMVRLLRIDHGYDAGRTLTMQIKMPGGQTPTPEQQRVFVERALAAVRGVPGVVSAGAMSGSLLERTLYGGSYRVEGFSSEWMDEGASIGTGLCCTTNRRVSAGTFRAVGAEVLRGRAFTADDAAAAPPVAIVNDRLARKFPPGLDPVGHWLVSLRDPADRRLIVGVVGDMRDMSLRWESLQAIYLPLEERGAAAVTIVARTADEPLAAAPALRQALQDAAGPVVVTSVGTLRELILGSVAEHRLNAWLFGSFGVLGLVLAAIGIFGVVSYSVAHRTREIGVRLALGASPAGVKRLITRQALVPVVAGLVAGSIAALALSRFVESLLYEVQATDRPTWLIVCAVLAGTGLAAAWLPARRAARVDPMAALRSE